MVGHTRSAQQRLGPRWYTGSADAILQSLNLVYDERPTTSWCSVPTTCNAWIRRMLDHHIATGAAVTVAGSVPRSEAFAFGCIDAGEDDLIRGWVEKPADPPGTPDDPDATFASMGNYIFTTDALIEGLKADAEKPDSSHDMGGDIIPALVEQQRAYVYDFARNVVPGETDRDRGYWRDVGTIDAFYDAHMDLVSASGLQPYNSLWPIRTQQDNLPPAKFVKGGWRRNPWSGQAASSRRGRCAIPWWPTTFSSRMARWSRAVSSFPVHVSGGVPSSARRSSTRTVTSATETSSGWTTSATVVASRSALVAW